MDRVLLVAATLTVCPVQSATNAFVAAGIGDALGEVELAKGQYLSETQRTQFLKDRIVVYQRVLATRTFKGMIRSGLLDELCFGSSPLRDDIIAHRPVQLGSVIVLKQFHAMVRKALLVTFARIPAKSRRISGRSIAPTSESRMTRALQARSVEALTMDVAPPGAQSQNGIKTKGSGWFRSPLSRCQYYRVIRPKRAWAAAAAECAWLAPGGTLAQPLSKAGKHSSLTAFVCW